MRVSGAFHCVGSEKVRREKKSAAKAKSYEKERRACFIVNRAGVKSESVKGN